MVKELKEKLKGTHFSLKVEHYIIPHPVPPRSTVHIPVVCAPHLKTLLTMLMLELEILKPGIVTRNTSCIITSSKEQNFIMRIRLSCEKAKGKDACK